MKKACKNCVNFYPYTVDGINYTSCDMLHDHQEGNILVKPDDFCTMFFEEKED